MRATRILALLVLTLTSLSTTAFADPPPASHHYWRNTAYPGHYVLYDQATQTWVETVNCQVLWRFALVRNEVNMITLYDASRGMTVKLDYQGMWLLPQGAAGFSLYQVGTFDTRTQFEHWDANGVYTGAITRLHGCGWHEWFPGGSSPAFQFVDSATSGDAVEIYDRGRDLFVRMDATRMYLKFGQNAYQVFKNGRWH